LDEREALIEERAGAGGDRIGELERLSREARREAEERGEDRSHFDLAVADAGFAPVVDADEFAALTARVAAERPQLSEAKRHLDAALAEAITTEKDLERRRDRVGEELTSLEQRTSNLP